ncbi:transmembrane protein [Ceratobasidium sp. AG-Ba]|nr:transmembrane protein [Ceratobasidium sp. AG-Ba]
MRTPAIAVLIATVAVLGASQQPTECADPSMTMWMRNSAGKTPCELVQDVLRVCDASFEIGFLPRSYTCNNGPDSNLAPCCCGSPTFALMSACWSCQYNVTFDLVTTTFTAFEKDCQALPNPITTYDSSVRDRINALGLPAWSEMEPLAGKWDMASAWKNSTPSTTSAMPTPTGYPYQITSTGISKGALAGAIVGAILGSKILFMLAGYVFWRWWKKQPGHQHDDGNEKGYVRQMVGEPRHHLRGRFAGRNRRGSRGQVDLDEDTSPRTTRWMIPPYLHPTSFHSHSSGLNSPAPAPAPDLNEPVPGDVTPFRTEDRRPESEKARTRRMSGSMRVTNDHHQDHTEGGMNIPAPLPALLARARTLSGDATPPHSPSLNLHSPLIHSGSSPLLASHGRSTSQSVSTVAGTDSSGVGPRRYQEDDAGVSLVIEDGRGGSPSSGSGSGGGGGGIRSVPPAYVDYRQGYSQADNKAPRFSSATASTEGGETSEGTTYIGSGSSRDHHARVEGVKKDEDEGSGSPTTVAPTVQAASSDVPVPSTEVPPMPTTENAPVPPTVSEDDARDRTISGDSEGAATIKPDPDLVPPPPPTRPIERSSTTDLAHLTAANTAANRSHAGPSTPATVVGISPIDGRPGTSGSSGGGRAASRERGARVSSRERGGRTASREQGGRTASREKGARTVSREKGGRTASREHGGRTTSGGSGGRPGSSGGRRANSRPGTGSNPQTRQSSAPTDPEAQGESAPAPAPSSWIWGRALGMFGIGLPGAAGPSDPPPKD